jgi:hypothetical protein
MSKQWHSPYTTKSFMFKVSIQHLTLTCINDFVVYGACHCFDINDFVVYRECHSFEVNAVAVYEAWHCFDINDFVVYEECHCLT